MSFQKHLINYAQKYRVTGVMLDTNLLLLYIFSHFSPDKIGTDRLQTYDRDSADLLLQYLARFERVLTTAHVLAETSNLARQMVKGKKWQKMCEAVFPLFCLPEQSDLKPLVVSTETLDRVHFLSSDFLISALKDPGLSEMVMAL